MKIEEGPRMFGGLWTTEHQRVPLEGVAIEGEVLGGHAHVRVRQTYVNREARVVESVYTFPLPSDGTLTGFRMECDGRIVEGVVQERERAFRAYDDAVLEGHGAALLEQERKNVFTASVGNLLPGERTVIEVEYVQRVQLDEGSMRVMIPTLVAPRYIPGDPSGSRTAHGAAAPTTRVPDADRITPSIGPADYRVTLDLLLDLGRPVEVSSPSHALSITREEQDRCRVNFARDEEPLDRDVVIEVRGAGAEQLAALCAHKRAEAEGYFALSVLPDLFELRASKRGQEVTFLIDTSGSMEGASIEQARAALRLCLRHLREQDRFNIVAFESTFRSFARQSVPFSQHALERADAWVASLRASGGTELLAPLVDAARANPAGTLVILTDGQVGNEREILQSLLREARGLRVYSFGIGTNVSDQLLRDLARETRGAVEFIYPGERIDEKVVAQFARAIAPRVDDLTVRFEGVEVSQLAPSPHAPLIDGEPWVLFGRYERGGSGKAIVRGKANGEPWVIEVPLALPERSERPAVAKLWASERIRDFERQQLEGRRADVMKQRIIELSIEHGVSSPYTSFVVIEKRMGDRRAEGGVSKTRVVPVHAPAGWAMFDGGAARQNARAFVMGAGGAPSIGGAPPRGAPMPMGPLKEGAARERSASYDAHQTEEAEYDSFAEESSSTTDVVEREVLASAALPPSLAAPSPATSPAKRGVFQRIASAMGLGASKSSESAASSDAEFVMHKQRGSFDPAEIMGQQLASGLWSDANDRDAVEQTARALWSLYTASISSAHPMYGTPIKKAVDALLERVRRLSSADEKLAAFALGVAWLIATGRRTRGEIEATAQGLSACADKLRDERETRRWVESLASTL